MTRSNTRPPAPPVDGATLDLLCWVAQRTATYREAWEVWQTSCPRHSTWEDAFIGGLLRSERRRGTSQRIVVLTPLGRSVLDGAT